MSEQLRNLSTSREVREEIDRRKRAKLGLPKRGDSDLCAQLFRERATKRHQVFEERDEPHLLGSLYVKNFAWEALGHPEYIEITIRDGHAEPPR